MLLQDETTRTNGSRDRVAAALGRLDPAARALLALSAHRGMSVGEIAEAMNTDPDVVAGWLRDAVREVAVDAGTNSGRPLTTAYGHLRELEESAWRPGQAPAPAQMQDDLAETRGADEHRRDERPRRWAPAAIYAVLLAAIALLVPLNDVWAAQVVSLGLLLTVPGSLLLRAIGTRGESVAAFPLYVPAASLAVLFAAGLSVDLLGPELSVSKPLQTGPMLAAVEVFCLVLLGAGARRPPA